MKDKIINNWPILLSMLEESHGVSPVAINTWIKFLEVVSIENNTIYFKLNNNMGDRGVEFIKKQDYDIFLLMCINQLFDTDYSIEIISNNPKEEVEIVREEEPTNLSDSNLNPKYTFDSFVVGDNSSFAHAACVAVAESPATQFNPLFLYGGVGLGKTHLMHAIGNYILAKKKNAKVLYVTSEAFTNELIESIKLDKNREFRDKYRNIDVLLIDDIQFIIGKTSTQEEFFHTFNALYEAKKQIIISSDKPPKDIETLEERLRTRFEWGVQADISSPNYETRMAILKKKVETDHILIDEDILKYIATNIKSNIRELEGALNKICVFSNLERKPIDLPLAEKALKDLITPEGAREITPELIIQTVAEHYGITVEDLRSKKKSQDIAYPRQIAMYLCRNMTDSSLQYIGGILGKRDHTTIMHGSTKIENDIRDNSNTANVIEVLKKKINPNM